MPLPEDTVLENRYRIDGLLAQGGMGAIYRGFDTNLSTPVAIKENFFQTPQAINQFKREALILARLRHPALPRVTHHFSFAGRQYLVMDFVEGEDLWEMVQRRSRPLDEAQALHYISQVCEAVGYLHRQNPPIIHRDIKPQNIKITPDGRAILVDFGIAKEVMPGDRTLPGAQGVTPGFSPPEQYSGRGTTPSSDVYALGATLYAVLTGKKPPDSISMMVGGAKFVPPDKINVNLSRRTSQAIIHAMQVQPADRPASAAAWQKELSGAVEIPTLPSTPVPPTDKEETLTAVAKPRPAPVAPRPVPLPVVPPPPVVATPPAKRSVWLVALPVLLATLILIGAIGAAVYILYSAGVLSFPPTLVAQVTQTVVISETPLSPTTPPTVISPTPVTGDQSALVQPTATPPQAVVKNTPTPTRAAKATATPTRAVTKNTPPPTAKATATATPTITPTPTTGRVQAGPTFIPLKSGESIPQIGAREVIDVDINPKNPREVYALVKGDGIYKSTNGGDGPWTRFNLDGSALVAFVIDPHNPARFYAPTWNAVLKSTDGGNTWLAMGNGLSTANRVVDVVTVDPQDPNLLYAGIGNSLVVSTDGGENWTSQGYGQGLVAGRMTEIVVDSFNHDEVYVAGFFGSIYKSVDSGRNFIALAYGVGDGVFGMTAHPTQRDVYLVGINSYQAGIIKTENGADFRPVSNGLIFGGADSAYSAITYAPGNPNIVYAGSGYEEDRLAKGIFKSTDGGESWTRISQGLSINPATGQPHYVKSTAVHPTNPKIVLAATGGGLYLSVDGGENWTLQ